MKEVIVQPEEDMEPDFRQPSREQSRDIDTILRRVPDSLSTEQQRRILDSVDRLRRAERTQGSYALFPSKQVVSDGNASSEMTNSNREVIAMTTEIGSAINVVSISNQKRPANIGEDSGGTSAKEGVALYALEQMGVAIKEKELAARYVTDKLPLRNGEGIVIDAGSTCVTFWECIQEKIARNDLLHLIVNTNNYKILEHWTRRISELPVRETKVEVIGSQFDPSHLAFYGPEAFQKLTSQKFRAAAVYIGTSGIEFDKTDGILFSYHGDDREREFKQLLFQCRAKMRVIIASSAKIGFTGGSVFDVLSIQELDTRAPIYLVTTQPKHGPKQTEEFEQARQVFESEEMRQLVQSKNPQLDFRWVILDPQTGEMVDELRLGKSTRSGVISGTLRPMT